MNHIASLTLALAAVSTSFVAASDAEAAGRRIVRPNADGGVTTAAAAGHVGPRGAAARAGRTSTGADGSAQHASGFAAKGEKGTLKSSGSATRAADGSVTQSRTTTATRSATGNSATRESGYDSATGRSTSTTCRDASGATIACPAKR